MMTDRNDNDQKIVELFADQRREDATHAPSFSATWQAAVSRATGRSHPVRLRIAAVIPIMATIVLLLLLFTGREESTVTGDTAVVGSWRSPTESLLESDMSFVGEAGSVASQGTQRWEEHSLSAWTSPTSALLQGPEGEPGL